MHSRHAQVSPATAARLRRASAALGFSEEPALSSQALSGAEPQSRELSGAWLAGTVLTGLTSVLLMGAALYVSFSGLDTFSTPYRALDLPPPEPASIADGKTARVRPVIAARSDREIFSASILENAGTADTIRNASFVRVAATLATAETALTDDVAAYAAEDYVDVVPEASTPTEAEVVPVAVLGAPAAEVRLSYSPLPASLVPPRGISDLDAAAFVGGADPGDLAGPSFALAYAGGAVSLAAPTLIAGIAENVTVVPKSLASASANRTTERIVKLDASVPLRDALVAQGFTAGSAGDVQEMIRNLYQLEALEPGSRLRILLGPSRSGGGLIPYRLSIYRHDSRANSDHHVVTVALTDTGRYVVATAPPEVPFAEDSTEQVDVGYLPSIYKSLWETGRRNGVPDQTIAQVVALVAYDTDLTRRIQPGDALEMLMSQPDGAEPAQLLYVGLTLGNSARAFYRFAAADGAVGFFDEQGESGKRFLLRRPLEGGGRLTSAMGMRIDPINGGNASHKGTDFAAPRGTPIYAAADGVVNMAQWYSGFGQFVRLDHINGYQTAYAHMNAIADGITPGTRVRQGQVIGYVGSTGRSTGNHLHFELEINGSIADPLNVKLPRARTLASQDMKNFRTTIEQVRTLMDLPAGSSST